MFNKNALLEKFAIIGLLSTLSIHTWGYAIASTKGSASDSGASTLEERYKALESLAKGLYYLETLYVDPNMVSPDSMVQKALKGITSSLDPHSTLLPQKAYEKMTNDTQGKFGGVGVIVSYEKNKLKVIAPIEGSPAWEEGIKSGDLIVEINRVKVEGMSGEEALERLKGDVGSKLLLKIQRSGVSVNFEVKLTRKIIKLASTRGQKLTENIGYAKVTSFQNDTTETLEKIIVGFGEFDGLILDLRDNPGGLLDQAIKVADLFLEGGVIVSTVGHDPKKIEREFAHKSGTLKNFPIVVLVNGGSASASEIVAGALQDHKRALLMGTKTFGKGSVQTVISLPNGTGLKLTIARYYTPLDRSIQAKGITPDVTLDRAIPGPGEQLESNSRKTRKESDLDGHISGDDLSDISKESGINGDINLWPENLRQDQDLKTAYSYLKGFKMFGPTKVKTE